MGKAIIVLEGKNNTGKAFSSATKDLLQLNASLLSFSAATLALKSGAEVINTLSGYISKAAEAWAGNERSLFAFNQAIKNSGLIGAVAAADLKNYANRMAEITGETGEAILNLQTYLVSTGRSGDEVKRIMQVAADMSVATGQSIDTVAKNLAKTYSGASGELANLIPEIKGLTDEQLMSGKAVDLLGQKYAGLSAALKDTTDVSIKNYKNALQDLQAEMGRASEAFFRPMRDWLTKIVNGWTDALKAQNDYKEALRKIEQQTATYEDKKAIYQHEINEYRKQIDILRADLNNVALYDPDLKSGRASDIKREINELNAKIGTLATSLRYMTQAQSSIDQASAAQARAAQDAADALVKQEQIVKDNYDKLVKFFATLEAQERRAAFFGETMDERVDRLRKNIFEFSELVRDMQLGPQGQELKNDINAKLLIDLNKTIQNATLEITNLTGPNNIGLTDFGGNIIGGKLAAGNSDINPLLSGMDTSLGGVFSMMTDSIMSAVNNTLNTISNGTDMLISGASSLMSNPAQAFGGGLVNIIGILDQFGSVLVGAIASAGPVVALFSALSIVTSGMMEVLEPIIKNLLDPLIGALRIFGNMIGQVLFPIFQTFAPIIEAFAQIFIWVSNYILRPVFNALYANFTLLTNVFLNFADLVKSIIDNWYQPWKIRGGSRSTNWYELYKNGPIKEIDEAMLRHAGETAATQTTAGSTGTSAQYSKPRDITINVDIETSALVGDDGIRQFALIIGRELKAAGVLGY